MNLGLILTRSAINWPDKEAFVFEGKRWTFRQFNQWANQAAHAYAAHGVRSGDRVAFLTWNLPELVCSFFGLLKIGAIPVPINYRLSANEVKYIVNDSGARILVFEESLRDRITPIRQELPQVEHFVYVGSSPEGSDKPFDSFVARASDAEPPVGAGLEDTAFIMYTSGTTGLPKGVLRSHRAELFASMTMASECRFRHEDTILNNKPLFHIAQLQIQLIPFIQLGARNIITRGFDIEETLSLCEQERITCLHGVPTQMVMMAQADLSRFDLRSLRCGFYGGQTLADDITRKLMPHFPDYFANIYGSTEALVVTACDYVRHPDKLGSVGKAAINMEARIVSQERTDPDDVVTEPYVAGQLIVRGPSMMAGYFNQPEKTSACLRDGWYWTGDAAHVDEQGFITVLGRMDHTIKSGGENIHPSEIENVLFKHPGIANAAVVGLPSLKWGQAVCAAVVRKDPALTAQALDAFCLSSPDLGRFKRPRHYFFVDEIPSNPGGKVERGKLKALLQAGLTAPLD